jgi:nitrogen regulatory protein PII
MYVLFIVLNDTKYLNDVLAKFVDLGVKGATMIDSQGMAGAIVEGDVNSIPLFGALKTIIQGTGNNYNKTIFTVLKNEALVDKVVETVKEVINGKAKSSTGFMFSIPVDRIFTFSDKTSKDGK